MFGTSPVVSFKQDWRTWVCLGGLDTFGCHYPNRRYLTFQSCRQKRKWVFMLFSPWGYFVAEAGGASRAMASGQGAGGRLGPREEISTQFL